MKVKHSIPSPQNSEPLTTQEFSGDKAATRHSNDSERTMAENPSQDKAGYLPAYEDPEADLPFEHDELLLKPDGNTTSKSPKVWQVKGSDLRLSALGATVAIKRGLYTYEDLTVYTTPLPTVSGPSDPITGALSATLGTIGTIAQRASDYPLLIAKVLDAKEEDEARAEIAKFANDSSKGMTGMVGAGLRAPMDITTNVSRGFHNLPKLYGDESVREVEKVTDVQSGLQAAGKGFGLGLWDGLSGLVTQPIKGAEEGGFMGGLIGFGKGLGGAVFKPAAGAVGIPANVFQGIYGEVQKTRNLGVENEVRETQILQGFREWDAATEEERNLAYKRIKRVIEDLETLES